MHRVFLILENITKKDILNFFRCETLFHKDYKSEEQSGNYFSRQIKALAYRDFEPYQDCAGSPMAVSAFKQLEPGCYINLILFQQIGKYQIRLFLDIVQIDHSGKAHIFDIKAVSRISQSIIREMILYDYFLKRSQIAIESFTIIHINRDYRHVESFRSKEFFIRYPMDLNLYEQKAQRVHRNYERFEELLKINFGSLGKIQRGMGRQCFLPEKCSHLNSCFPDYSEENVLNLSALDFEVKWQMAKKMPVFPLEAKTIRHFHLSEKNKTALNALHEKKIQINHLALSGFLSRLEYPLAFLDFESIMPLLPFFQGLAPFQSLVVQFSLHILLSKETDLQHHEFLIPLKVYTPTECNYHNLREYLTELAVQLVRSVPRQGSIVVYDKTSECSVLNLLAELLPQFRLEMDNFLGRIIDLSEVFKKYYYYDYRQMGSFSLKKIAPLFNRETDYTKLGVSHGGELVKIFYDVFSPDISEAEKKNKLKDIFLYCYTDTLSLLSIVQGLEKINNPQGQDVSPLSTAIINKKPRLFGVGRGFFKSFSRNKL